MQLVLMYVLLLTRLLREIERLSPNLEYLYSH